MTLEPLLPAGGHPRLRSELRTLDGNFSGGRDPGGLSYGCIVGERFWGPCAYDPCPAGVLVVVLCTMVDLDAL